MERNGGGGGGGVTAGKGKKHELVKQLRFPPGFHFVPTEEELVDVYLRAKIEGRELPLQVVNHVDLLDWEPGKLVEEYKGFGENKWYFFTKRESKEKNEPTRQLRPVAGVKATWKSTGSLTPIHRTGKDGKKEEEAIGTKRILIYQAEEGVDDDGKWSMHEYDMEEKPKMDQFVLCTIQRKLHWDKAGEGAAGGNKRKRGRGTDVEPAKTLGRKKATTSRARAQEGPQQQHQETTSDGSVEPLMHEQAHQSFRLMDQPLAFDATSLSAAVPQGYPDGNHQLGASAQMYAGYAHMAPNFQYGDPVMFYDQGQQLLSYADHRLISPISSGEHAARHQFCRQELEPLLPYPPPLEDANLYSNSTYDGRIHSGTSTLLVQQSTDDFLEFTGVHDDHGVGSQLLGSGYGDGVGTSEATNIQASLVCQDGLFCGVCR